MGSLQFYTCQIEESLSIYPSTSDVTMYLHHHKLSFQILAPCEILSKIQRSVSFEEGECDDKRYLANEI